MNEILVARKAFAATLTSSAVAKSVLMTGSPGSSNGRYTSRMVCSAAGEFTPNTSRSGCRVSCTAKPSRRNSGFQAISTAPESTWACLPSSSCSRCAVPTGTVDLPTIRHGRLIWSTSASNTDCT